jgi:hypothetical protein
MVARGGCAGRASGGSGVMCAAGLAARGGGACTRGGGTVVVVTVACYALGGGGRVTACEGVVAVFGCGGFGAAGAS